MASRDPTVPGLRHTASFYGSDGEFVDVAGAACETAAASGEPVVVRVEPRRAELLQAALPSADRMTFLPREEEYRSPASAFASVLELCREHAPERGKRLLLLGELPPLRGLARDAWMRYEATVNQVLGDQPIHALCVFDDRAIAEPVRSEILRTHHHVVSTDGVRRASPLYQHPEAFIASGRHPARDPLEDEPPDVALTDPAPSAAREAIAALAARSELAPVAADHLVTGVSEVLANAIVHGRPPVCLWAWAAPRRVVAAVSDRGRGPVEPFVGVVPAATHMPEGGLGLWIAHQLCPEIAMWPSGDGFTVRLAAGPGPRVRQRSTSA